MARIRIIEKKANTIEIDAFKDITAVSNTANSPALVTIEHSGEKTVVEFSYTGSTEHIVTTHLHGGVDVSTGIKSGRIVRIEGIEVSYMAEALNSRKIGDTSRAIRNYELSKSILAEVLMKEEND